MRSLLYITIFSVCSFFALTGCKTKYIEIPLETIKEKIEYKDRFIKDSIYTHDSIFVDRWKSNDTIFLVKEKYKYLYRDKIKIDSVRIDSIIYQEKAIYVDKPIPYYPKWMKILSSIGGIGILILIFVAYRKIKKII